MQLNTFRVAISLACATAVLWTVCSAMVATMPAAMMWITGHMLHAHMQDLAWTMTWTGYFVGLVSWTLSAASTGWLIAWFYNRVSRSP
jgi:hypothetical protein